MLKSLKKAREKLEVFFVWFGLAVVPRFPRKMILYLARAAGLAGYYLVRSQRRLTMANMQIVFGDRKTAAEKRKIAIQAFQTMALVFLDYFWFSRNTNARIVQYVTFDPSILLFIPPPPPQVIGVTAHFGNWELMSRAFAATGRKHTAVVAANANPEVEQIMQKVRAIDETDYVVARGAVRKLLRSLNNGKHIALVLDQNTKPAEGGIFVDFFGLPIPMSTIAAVIAQRTNVPIVMIFCMAYRDGRYMVYARPPIRDESLSTGDPDAVRRMTQNIAAVFQEEIEKHPEQWLWMYKRWKHIKPGQPPGAYPYYAKPLG